MSVGVRNLTVLGEFKPFGLIAEALDGKSTENVPAKYDYFLFDPEIARERDETDAYGQPGPSLNDTTDHELFIRANRIIWTTGSRVYKRFTFPLPVIKVCWCRLNDLSEAFLCVLQTDTLTIFNISGEVISIPLPRTVTSIWSLPSGLLLQQSAESKSSTQVHFSSSASLLNARDVPRSKREGGQSPPHNFSLLNTFDNFIKGDRGSISSHMVLKDSLEEPQPIYVEERGKFNIIKEFDEKTIWTSDQIPLMASYNEGKMQHSLWVEEPVNSEVANAHLSGIIPVGVLPRQFSFRKIWQGKGAQTAAIKVFLGTDDDDVPVICFLLHEQKKLLSVRLQILEINNEVIFDVTPDMSWSLLAIAAAPVIVTRPRGNVGPLPFADIIVLAPDGALLLYSGKQCLCRYLLPSSFTKDRVSCNLESSKKAPTFDDLKITGLVDAVEGRINVIVSSGEIFRCALRRSPSSSLVNDCLSAMATGLSSGSYNNFLIRLWGEGDFSFFSKADSVVDLEWESFSGILTQMCRKSSPSHQPPMGTLANSSWDFLVNSQFHKNYSTKNYCATIASGNLLGSQKSDTSTSFTGEKILEKSLYSEFLMESLASLHAVYEGLKLDILRKWDLQLLVVLLCDIASFLGELSYLDHYIRDFPDQSKKFGVRQNSLPCRAPPNVYRWLETCLQYGCSSANSKDLPPLIYTNGSSVVSWARKVVAFYSLLSGARQMGKKISTGVYCNIALGSSCNCEELTILAMVGERYGLQQIDLLPAGVSLPLRHALDKCRESPPIDWPAAAYVLLGREDLALSCLAHSRKPKELETQTNVNLISMSSPYMLHLHPVTIPSPVSDTIGLDNTKLDDTETVDGTIADGMEHIFNFSTQLRYGRDMRLKEVRRLLCSASPVAIQTSANPSASDQDLQQAQLWQLAQRTTALPFGRGAFTLATTCTLLTEALTVPKLVLAGRLPAQQNATVNLDPDIRNLQELKSWPEFHNAVAAGLRLSPLQGKMSRTWITYNKPKEEPDVTHAGLLLALGLHGHLHVLNISDVYQYLSQEHESTTVGLLLGLAASYRGTMQPAVSKSLFVHIPGQHASSFPELELPTLLQSAALVSVGLLFEGSAHPQTMQILLAEMGRRSGGDNVLEREGYAVSAGFALGLVALARGEDSLGFKVTMINRLFQYVGGKDSPYDRTCCSTISVDEQSRSSGQMMDVTPINVDVTAPGAIIALALLFLKTESEAIVSMLSIPQTHFDLQYVRPDFIMLRVIACNLIMWNRVYPSKDWIQAQIPEIVKKVVRSLRDEIDDIDEMDAEAFVQAYVNIVTGACISLGLRFAGTKNGNAQELLYEYAVYFLNEIKPVSATSGTHPKGLSQYVDRGTLEICLHLIVLSLSVIMAGSGHLQTLRLLRFLRTRNSAEGQANYGLQMSVSLAIGFLFLGGGMRTFSTSNGAIAALFITLYPRLPTGPNDNRCHLQAFRHMYVLATEARWIQTVDVDTGLPVYVPLEVTVKETEHYAETSFCEVTPCILPERAILKTVRVCGPRYWTQVIEIVPEDTPWWVGGDKNDPFNSGVLYVKRKVGACSYVDDPIGCQSLLSRAMHKVFGLTSLRASAQSNNGQIGPGSITVDQLISTFSSDPSLIAFAQLCCDPSWNIRSDTDFKEFCLRILFECVSKDRPALLQVYMSLYTTIGSMVDLVIKCTVTSTDSLAISSLKIALAYNEALLSGRLATSRGGIIQCQFIGSIRKQVDQLLTNSHQRRQDFSNYLNSEGGTRSILLSWYLQWFNVPAPSVVKTVVENIKALHTTGSTVPLLRLLLPTTHITALTEIDKLWVSSS